MNKKLTYIFMFILTFVCLGNIISEDLSLSLSERRPLESFPDLTIETVLNGDFMEDFEAYALDQFMYRDTFKSLKTYVELYIFGKNDVNGLYVYKEFLIKRIEDYRENNIDYFTNYIHKLGDKFSEESKIYYMIIPDKNYYVEDDQYRTIDYKALFEKINRSFHDYRNINASDLLTLEDYYKTDTHWRQESLEHLVLEMSEVMSIDINFNQYEEHEYNGFLGVYGMQSALNSPSESLIYLTADSMQNVIVTNYNSPNSESLVYELDKLGEMDSYDVFLGGASPLITIENKNNTNGKELIIFRDSFGSSLAPLLIESYGKITLIDTRYMPSALLDEYMEFSNQDVLFMYNTEVINNSQSLR